MPLVFWPAPGEGADGVELLARKHSLSAAGPLPVLLPGGGPFFRNRSRARGARGGLVHFSAKGRRLASKPVAENMDLSPSAAHEGDSPIFAANTSV